MVSSNTGGGGIKEESPADGGDPSASDSPAFAEGERVLAYHGPCLYEAKVQKSESRMDEWRYYVHYLGWSKNWDEWMEADRLLKLTDENVRKQKELEKKQSAEKISKSGRSMQNKPKNSNDAKLDKEEHKSFGSRGKKRKGQSGGEEEDTRSVDKLALLQFPLTLKKQLVDDWEFVTQLGLRNRLERFLRGFVAILIKHCWQCFCIRRNANSIRKQSVIRFPLRQFMVLNIFCAFSVKGCALHFTCIRLLSEERFSSIDLPFRLKI